MVKRRKKRDLAPPSRKRKKIDMHMWKEKKEMKARGSLVWPLRILKVALDKSPIRLPYGIRSCCTRETRES